MPRNFLKDSLTCVLCLIILLAGMISARPALANAARPVLVSASPAPESVFVAAPDRVLLEFDGALSDEGSSLQVLNAEGERVDNGDAAIDPADRSQISVSLPALIEGVYTVSYAVREIGGSVIITSQYTFVVQPPPPSLSVQNPVDGQSFDSGEITFDMGTQFFNFGNFNNRIRIYVDGDLQAEVQRLQHTLTLDPGVHQLRIVLARFEDDELTDTEVILNVAVADPSPSGSPPPGTTTLGNIPLTPQAQIAAIALTLLLLAAGYFLGRQPDERDL